MRHTAARKLVSPLVTCHSFMCPARQRGPEIRFAPGPKKTSRSTAPSNAEQCRKKLLELTSRNPLISFRHSERSRSHLRVIEDVPERLFSRLAHVGSCAIQSEFTGPVVGRAPIEAPVSPPQDHCE